LMDGFEATRQIKQLFPELPIIAQTAYSSDKDRSKILECGCDDLIIKPFDVNLFKSILNKYIGLKKTDKQN
jgi:CheY-like chemotaxis protein